MLEEVNYSELDIHALGWVNENIQCILAKQGGWVVLVFSD